MHPTPAASIFSTSPNTSLFNRGASARTFSLRPANRAGRIVPIGLVKDAESERERERDRDRDRERERERKREIEKRGWATVGGALARGDGGNPFTIALAKERGAGMLGEPRTTPNLGLEDKLSLLGEGIHVQQVEQWVVVTTCSAT